MWLLTCNFPYRSGEFILTGFSADSSIPLFQVSCSMIYGLLEQLAQAISDRLKFIKPDAGTVMLLS